MNKLILSSSVVALLVFTGMAKVKATKSGAESGAQPIVSAKQVVQPKTSKAELAKHLEDMESILKLLEDKIKALEKAEGSRQAEIVKEQVEKTQELLKTAKEANANNNRDIAALAVNEAAKAAALTEVITTADISERRKEEAVKQVEEAVSAVKEAQNSDDQEKVKKLAEASAEGAKEAVIEANTIILEEGQKVTQADVSQAQFPEACKGSKKDQALSGLTVVKGIVEQFN